MHTAQDEQSEQHEEPSGAPLREEGQERYNCKVTLAFQVMARIREKRRRKKLGEEGGGG